MNSDVPRSGRACRTTAVLAAALAAAAACYQATSPTPPRFVAPTFAVRTPLPPLATGAIAIVGADVVPMTGSEVLPDRTVVVRAGRISAVGPEGDVVVPPGAVVIAATGQFLIPGLMDMHAHVHREDLEAYHRAGITTIRNMWGTPEVAKLRQELADGADYPTLLSAGPGMDGDPPVWDGSAVETDPGEARAEVRRQARNWDFIKVYNRLKPAVFRAILEEAAEIGITVAGHVPLASTIDEASEGGLASVEHMTGIAEAVADGRSPAGWLRYDPDSAAAVARRLAERGTRVCPTLDVLRHLAVLNLPPAAADRAQRHQRAMVKALLDAGVPLLAGTDAGIGAVEPGISLDEELALLVEAGLSPFQALQAATSGAARFFGLDDQLGTIEVGKRADLILLDGNPLDDINAVRHPVGMIQRGRRIF